jgi:hypothetical protein
MHIKTILNRIQKHPRFVYTDFLLREVAGRLVLDVRIRPRATAYSSRYLFGVWQNAARLMILLLNADSNSFPCGELLFSLFQDCRQEFSFCHDDRCLLLFLGH